MNTAEYYVAGTAFGSPVAEPRLPRADLLAIAARAQRERAVYGDEAYQLGAGLEKALDDLDDSRVLISALRRQLAVARDQLVVQIHEVSYAELRVQWAEQDAKEMADLERRQVADEQRSRMR